MKRLAILALGLIANPAFASDAPRQPDMQAVAAEFQRQMIIVSQDAAVCRGENANLKRDLAEAKKSVEPKSP